MHLLQTAVYGYRVTTICATIRKMVDDGAIDTYRAAMDVLAEADGLEAQSLDSLLPGAVPFQARSPGVPPDNIPFNFRAITTRTFYAAYKLRLNVSLCQLAHKVRALFPAEAAADAEMLQSRIQTCVATIQNFADEILAGVPDLFISNEPIVLPETGRPRYWSDGLRLLWPLRLVAFWPQTRPDQKQVALAILARLQGELGIRQAVDICHTGSLAPLAEQ